jgi:ferredoxin
MKLGPGVKSNLCLRARRHFHGARFTACLKACSERGAYESRLCVPFGGDENPARYGIICAMPAEADSVKPAGLVPDELKCEPRSKGLLTPRKKKPKELAVITECCTGCAGSPACVEYCPVEDCMFWVPDEDHPPFGRIQVDPILCIGCKKCLSKGPDGCFLDGCPWDAIVMVETVEVEKEVGVMPI